MHNFLNHFMFRWNIDRRRSAKMEIDWHTYDLMLLHNAFQSCVRVVGDTEASELWQGGITAPRRLQVEEHFGVMHHHVTQSHHIALASGELPFSDDLVNRILEQYAFSHPLISQEEIAFLLQSTAPLVPPPPLSGSATHPISPSSSTPSPPSSDPCRVLPPVSHMTVVEQRLLADVMRHDDLMRDAVKKGEWDIAASRWNSFVTRCSTERIIHENLRQAMHLVTGDVLRKAVVAINKRAEVESEKKAIALKATLSTLTFDYLSPLQSPFTEYENTVLLLYVKKYSTTSKSRAKDIIRWKELTSAWLVRHQAERESLQVNRLILRAEKVLRSHYQTLSKAVKRVLTSTGDAPALSASEDAGALTIAQSPMHSTSAPASSSSPSALASDAVSTASPLDAPRLDPPSQPPASPLPCVHHLPPHLPSTKWSAPATVRFNQLCAERGYRWNYQEFNKVWPHIELGDVSHERWAAKNRIEREKRKRLAAEGDAQLAKTTKRRLTELLHGEGKRIATAAQEE